MKRACLVLFVFSIAYTGSKAQDSLELKFNFVPNPKLKMVTTPDDLNKLCKELRRPILPVYILDQPNFELLKNAAATSGTWKTLYDHQTSMNGTIIRSNESLKKQLEECCGLEEKKKKRQSGQLFKGIALGTLGGALLGYLISNGGR
jgi:hypothetical protein